MIQTLHRMYSAVLDTLLPILCAGCGVEGNYVCPDCVSTLTAEPYIQKFPLEKSEITVLSLQSINLPMVRKLIHLYKYDCVAQAHTTIRKVVQKLYSCISGDILRDFLEDSILVPIPLHWRRLKWRGYNQSQTIAEAIAGISENTLRPPEIKKLLFRSKSTKTQVGQDKKERQHNLNNVFSINHEIARSLTRTRKLLLIDDVVTTGSTLKEAAHVLAHRFPYSPLFALTVAYAPIEQKAQK